MGNLITTFSSVEAFANSCSNNYSAILARANETLSQVEKMLYAVQADSERLAQQIIRGRQMLDEIQLKVEKYQALMEDAAADVDRCNAEIDYILSHPITRTYTDEDGNEHTVEEIDEAALAAAERALDQAQALYEQYRDKYEEATAVMYNVSVTVTRFEQIKNGIDAVAQSIQSDIYEIKKYINAILNESEYNLQTLHAAIDGIAAYLASRPINMPVGTIFSDYSASGGTSSYSGSSGGAGNIALDEVAATSVSDSHADLSGSNSKTIYGIKSTKFENNRIEIMSSAFDNAEKWIVSHVEELGAKVKIKEKKKVGAYYSPSHKQIVMTQEYNNEDFQDVFKHEFGHFVDHSNGWLSEQKEFRQAFEKECNASDLGTFPGAEKTLSMLSDLFNNDSAKFDRHVSDILSSIYQNNEMIQTRYDMEGLEYYKHDNSYWVVDHNRENEIFADLFAIYSTNDPSTVAFVERHFPDLTSTFKKVMER